MGNNILKIRDLLCGSNNWFLEGFEGDGGFQNQ